jgi:heat shock protein HtpX
MVFLKRMGLFLLTNLLVLLTISIVWGFVSQALHLTGLSSNMTLLLAFCFVWGMGGAFISLLLSKWMAKMAMGVQVIEPDTANPDLRRLVSQVHELSRRAGLDKMPEVGIFESPDLNAFATGPTRNNSLVAVSTGLLQRMTDAEREGVIGHEIAHIANGDMVTMTLIQGVVNAFVMFFARIVAGIVASQFEERNRNWIRFMVTFVAEIAFSVLGMMVVSAFSRYREFRADAGGAGLAGRDKMIAALLKLKQVYELPLDEGMEDNQNVATLMISSRSKGGLRSLFMTHPSLDDRIDALRNPKV